MPSASAGDGLGKDGTVHSPSYGEIGVLKSALVFGDEKDVGAREAARLEGVVEKPGIWIKDQAAKVVAPVEPREQVRE